MFVDELARAGFDIWYDREGLYVGAQWVQTLEQELQARQVYIIVITPDSLSSQWVQSELSLALVHHKPIIGIICKPTQISGFLTNYQLLDAMNLTSREATRETIIVLNVLDSPKSRSHQRANLGGGSTLDVSGEWADESVSYAPKTLALSQTGNKIVGLSKWSNDEVTKEQSANRSGIGCLEAQKINANRG